MSGARFSVSHYGTPFSFRLSLLLLQQRMALRESLRIISLIISLTAAQKSCARIRGRRLVFHQVLCSLYISCAKWRCQGFLSLAPSRLLILWLPSLSLQVEDRSLSPGGRAGSRKRQKIFSVVYPTRFRAGQRTGSTFSRTRNPNSCRFFFPPDPQATRTENCTRQLK